MVISKSEYMMFLKQPAWLWIKKNDPSKIPPVDDNTQALFDAGNQFEPYAECLFPEGAKIGFSFDDSENGYFTMPKRTHDAIDAGAQVLFQPRFEWQNFTCISDVLSFVSKDTVDLYEIKASTKVKVDHEFDLAFQAAVLEGVGLTVRNIFVIHVNNEYVKNGSIEADKLTKIEDVTEKVKAKKEATDKYMPLALKLASLRDMPDPSPDLAKLGSKKDWLKIYANIIPKVEEDQKDAEPTIQHNKISSFIDDLKYPLYFLDYETMMSLIPYFDGHRPYQQVPFQYSLHIIEFPGAELTQKVYLHRENSDPSRPLAEQLIKDIGTKGSVLVWYESFEKKRNTELGEMYPDLQEQMEAINDRVVDLIIPFKSKWYDDPRFNGSASIKYVMPVLVPSLSYKELGIQEGASAQRLWMEAILDEKRVDQKDKILDDLNEYCKLDTLAMVKIWEVLNEL